MCQHSSRWSAAAGEFGHEPSLLRLVWFWRAVTAQESCLLNNAGKVRDRPGVDGRRLKLLPDFPQVSAGQDGQEAGFHARSKRTPQR
jgi:hypothetical protein